MDASLAINPEYAELDAENLQIVRDMHGKIRWSIYDNTFKSIDDCYNRHVEFEVSFNTESIDSESFRMECHWNPASLGKVIQGSVPTWNQTTFQN